MNWADERYVRLYTRDTTDWMVLPWQSRAVWPLLLRKLDRAGTLPIGKHGAKGLAALLMLPVEVVEAGLDGLLVDGCVVLNNEVLVAPNFLEAQENTASNAKRCRDYRMRNRDAALRDDASRGDTQQHGPTREQHVGDTKHVATDTKCVATDTQRHEPTRSDTPCRAVPSRAVPEALSSASPTPAPADGASPQKPDATDAPKGAALAADAVRIWNEGVPSSVPRVRECDGARRKKLMTRCDEHGGGLEWLTEVVAKVRASPFLRGDRGWKVTFDWILEPSNLRKVLEGNYDDTGKVGGFHEITEADRAVFKTQVGIINDF